MKPEPQQVPGAIEYIHGDKAVVLREDYGRKEISYSIRKPADPTEKIGTEREQSQAMAEEMAERILGSKNGEKMKVQIDEELSYGKEVERHLFWFLHVYENGLMTTLCE